MIKAYIGIDPGLTGAIGLIQSDGVACVFDIPTIKNAKNKAVYDYYGMYRRIVSFAQLYDGLMLSLERQQAMPQQGVSSTFQTGVGYGAWLALCWAVTPKFEIVSPRKWKKALGLTNDKEKSRAMAIKLYPDLADSLKRKKDHNRAEAVLLARYTQLQSVR